MKYLIANWKAQMTLSETIDWLHSFTASVTGNHALIDALHQEHLGIIICPPFPFITYVREHINELPIKVGAQDLSSVKPGKFTGEVTADALKDVVEYVIVGHSERRNLFDESEQEIELKTSLADQYDLKSILCVRSEMDLVYENAKLVAYEPVEAIGSGENADVEDVIRMKKTIQLPTGIPFLYGGSADASNIADYLETNEVDGFLVGTASLDQKEFYQMAVKMLQSS